MKKNVKRRRDYKTIADTLAKRVIWALKFLKVPGGGGLVMSVPTKKGSENVAKPWEDWFMDALDDWGLKVDREAYYASIGQGKKKRRRA